MYLAPPQFRLHVVHLRYSGDGQREGVTAVTAEHITRVIHIYTDRITDNIRALDKSIIDTFSFPGLFLSSSSLVGVSKSCMPINDDHSISFISISIVVMVMFVMIISIIVIIIVLIIIINIINNFTTAIIMIISLL